MIILTSASENRRSFGRRGERRYTYYGGCLLTELPNATCWQNPHGRTRKCIETKEAALRELASERQAFFGRNMKDLPLPRAR